MCVMQRARLQLQMCTSFSYLLMMDFVSSAFQLSVSAKKSSNLFLNELTEGTSTTCEGSQFQSLITLWEKKFLWMLRRDNCLYSLNWCPLRLWSLEASVKNLPVDESTPSLPDIILYASIKSLFFFSSPRL